MEVIIDNEKFHHNMEGYTTKKFVYSELVAIGIGSEFRKRNKKFRISKLWG